MKTFDEITVGELSEAHNYRRRKRVHVNTKTGQVTIQPIASAQNINIKFTVSSNGIYSI